jgi:ketosteroid isomerase-like protein
VTLVWETEGPQSISFAGIRHGLTETTGFFEAIARDHSDPQLTIDHYVADGDTVATFGRYRAVMKATGKAADTPIAHYWTLRDNKVVRYVGFINSSAFEDALNR